MIEAFIAESFINREGFNHGRGHGHGHGHIHKMFFRDGRNSLVWFFELLLSAYALYLHFSWNKGVTFGVLGALFFPVFYIIYYAAMNKTIFVK
jgi:hypothetical protein